MNLKEVFHDVTPIAQDDGPHPVCSIDYPNGFVEAMDYFRAIIKKDERSERALELTAVCLTYNPANYTTWWFRRQCLASLSEPLVAEGDGLKSKYTYFDPIRIDNDLELAAEMGGRNPKNYQIWYHRRNLLEKSFVETAEDDKTSALIDEELEYIETVLENDSKNYHAWSHRQWILKTINISQKWEEELSFIDKLISEDVRNNSAWNQRWFATHRGSKSAQSLESAQNEVNYAIEKAGWDPYNESPWKYFVAIIKEQFRSEKGGNIGTLPFIEACEVSLLQTKETFEKETKKDGMECNHLIAAHIDILEMKASDESRLKAVDLARALETRYDPIRRKYWKLRSAQLRETLQIG